MSEKNYKSHHQVQDLHRIKQLSQANCLIVLDENSVGANKGEQVIIQLFDWV